MLNYAAVLTRPDILYPVSRLAQKCSNPTAGDLRKVYRVFRYLQGTKHLGITFKPGDGKVTLYGYVDASYHTYDNAASQYGYSFSLHSKGTSKDSSFYARSSKMKLVTLSSTESEYVAAAEATGEIMFLRQLLSDIGFPQSKPPTWLRTSLPKALFQNLNLRNSDTNYSICNKQPSAHVYELQALSLPANHNVQYYSLDDSLRGCIEYTHMTQIK
jgi:hypothetical protein